MNINPNAIRREESGAGRGRYVYPFDDGSEAELAFFERPEGIVTIDHTTTPKQHRGHGIGSTLVARAVADFRTDRQKVIPACPFAYKQFKKHPDWRDVLHRP